MKQQPVEGLSSLGAPDPFSPTQNNPLEVMGDCMG